METSPQILSNVSEQRREYLENVRRELESIRVRTVGSIDFIDMSNMGNTALRHKTNINKGTLANFLGAELGHTFLFMEYSISNRYPHDGPESRLCISGYCHKRKAIAWHTAIGGINDTPEEFMRYSNAARISVPSLDRDKVEEAVNAYYELIVERTLEEVEAELKESQLAIEAAAIKEYRASMAAISLSDET